VALVARARRAAEGSRTCTRAQTVTSLAYAAVVIVLSLQPALNLASGQQAMNASFDRLHLVNTYGAFGTVGRERDEIIFEGTNDETVGPYTAWREYEFPFKPGNPFRCPGICAPYQPRLDWAIWFAAMAGPREYPWTIHFVWKLLHNDPGTLSLLANNPFPDKPPRTIRAQLYRYEFADPKNPDGRWWNRTLLGPWLPPLTVGHPVWTDTRRIYGWPEPKEE
jgi:hypothetical protein